MFSAEGTARVPAYGPQCAGLLELAFTEVVTAMAKSMSKSALMRHLAETNELTRKQVVYLMDTLVTTAYKEAKNGFMLPGVGKLVLVKRKARLGRNPATGEQIKIPAKTVVKFRVAKAAKDAILGAKK